MYNHHWRIEETGWFRSIPIKFLSILWFWCTHFKWCIWYVSHVMKSMPSFSNFQIHVYLISQSKSKTSVITFLQCNVHSTRIMLLSPQIWLLCILILMETLNTVFFSVKGLLFHFRFSYRFLLLRDDKVTTFLFCLIEGFVFFCLVDVETLVTICRSQFPK